MTVSDTTRTPQAVPPADEQAPPTKRHTGRGLVLGSVLVGVVTVVLGVLTVALPLSSLLVAAVFLGVSLVVLGALRVVAAFGLDGASTGFRVLVGILGVVTVLAGLYALVAPGVSLLALAVLIAVGWLAAGVADLVQAFGAGLAGWERTILALSGLLALAAGVLVLVFPFGSLLVFAGVAGIALIVLGVAQIVGTFAWRHALSA